MSRRLQVLMPEEELMRLQSLARQNQLSLGEWVRRTLREAADEASVKPIDDKLEALRRATEYSFPTGDVEKMNQEIEMGYRAGLP